MISQFPFLLQGLLQRICVRIQKEKTTTLRDLIHIVGFPYFHQASNVLGVTEARIHYLTVEFKVFRGFGFSKLLRGLGLRV